MILAVAVAICFSSLVDLTIESFNTQTTKKETAK